MPKIFIGLSLIFITFNSISQEIVNITHLPSTINTIGSELNFLQINEKYALYTSSTLEGEKYQSLIFRTELKNESWQRGIYFNLIDAHSVGNINYRNNDTVFYFSACDKFENCKIVKKHYKNSNAIVLKNKINTPNAKNTQPHKTIFNNQSILYFVSNRKGGFGGLDIWFSIIDENGNYGEPINAGNRINSPFDEITPFYNVWTGELFFSSNRGDKKTGFDIYKSLGSLNYWGESKEVKELNSSDDELYVSFYNNYCGYFSSNRSPSIKDEKNCCNDIFYFEYPRTDSLPIYFNDTIKKHLPIKLYFHNDEPESQTLRPFTMQTYKEAYVSYYLKKEEYLKMHDMQARKSIDLFFEKTLKGNYNKLNTVLDHILISLKNGKKIILHVKGFSSPLYNERYNTNLSKRRISSFINMITSFKNSEFKRYLQNGDLEIIQLPFGENNSKKSVSDNPKDRKKSVYSIDAMLERKIEIVEIMEL